MGEGTFCIRFLLDCGADIRDRDNEGRGVIQYAAMYGNEDMFNLALENGLSVEDTDSEGNTGLLLAAMYGTREAVQFLIARGANITHLNRAGENALMCAALGGRGDTVRELLATGLFDVNSQAANGKTALIYASCVLSSALLGNHGCLVALLEAPDIDVNKADHEGTTALMAAANSVFSGDCLEKLLKVDGVDLNAVDRLHETALMKAARTEHHSGYRALINAGADTTIVNREGKTAKSIYDDEQRIWKNIDFSTLYLGH